MRLLEPGNNCICRHKLAPEPSFLLSAAATLFDVSDVRSAERECKGPEGTRWESCAYESAVLPLNYTEQKSANLYGNFCCHGLIRGFRALLVRFSSVGLQTLALF